jgi:enoyl-CoA hydratase
MALDVRDESGYQVWSMAFEPVNAIAPPFLEAIESALDDALADETIAVVVLTSALRVFSAGADAAWIGEVVRERGPEELLREFNATMDRFRALCLRLRQSEILFVAALNGHTLAGGLELAAACDLRFVADSERLQIGVSEFALFGVMPSGGGGTQYLSRLGTPAQILNFILEGEPCGPRRAFELGLVERVLEADSLLTETEAFADRTARRGGRIGVNAAKRLVLDAAHLPLGQALQTDHQVHWDAMRRGGFIPGVSAFVERFG